MEIFKWIEGQEWVSGIVVKDFRNNEATYYLNLSIDFKNGSSLHCKEYLGLNQRKYSFHWQNKNGDLIRRWDNAPHHPEIATFPHHVHLPNGQILNSYDISIEEVMTVISTFLKK